MTASAPLLSGVYHVKLPVSDLDVSRAWYQSRLGYQVKIEFTEHGTVMGVGMVHPNGGPRLGLRLDPDRAAKTAGFDYFAIDVPTRKALDALAQRLTDLGETHAGVHRATFGWTLPLTHDPDGHEVRFYCYTGDAAGDPGSRPPGASEDANLNVVRDFYEQIWNDGTLSAIDQVVSDHRVDHDPDAGGSGRLDIAEAVQRYRTAFPDLSFTFGPQFADGDLVATVWQATGNHTGPLDQIPATSRRAVVAGIFVDRLAGGQIVESWTSYDRLGLLQQLGVLPTI